MLDQRLTKLMAALVATVVAAPLFAQQAPSPNLPGTNVPTPTAPAQPPATQQASAGCRLPERVTVAVCQRRAELALLAEVGAQPAGLEPEPRVEQPRLEPVRGLRPEQRQCGCYR